MPVKIVGPRLTIREQKCATEQKSGKNTGECFFFLASWLHFRTASFASFLYPFFSPFFSDAINRRLRPSFPPLFSAAFLFPTNLSCCYSHTCSRSLSPKIVNQNCQMHIILKSLLRYFWYFHCIFPGSQVYLFVNANFLPTLPWRQQGTAAKFCISTSGNKLKKFCN